ncbi:MAG: TerB family tellurite resistance protein [Gammaproteobacteria bacterium]|nr:TerB family tellurite resistance protein [Gammaproteobacteria bacterium]
MVDMRTTNDQAEAEGFDDIDRIVAEPLKFKVKLAIGEDAYTSLKVKNAVVQAWDVAGVATTAAVVAKSSVVASTFFAPSGLLAAIGIGTAVTPIGWVIAAGVVTGGAWFGVTRHLKKATASKLTVVPNFINTPLDVLALGLFDLMMPLALKLVIVNGRIDAARRQQVGEYFVGEWGYDAGFVDAGMRHIESRLEELSVAELAQTMAEFASHNRDCNFHMMSREILDFLRHIAELDGVVDAGEESAMDEIESIFKAANRFSLRGKLRAGWSALKARTSRILR